MNDTSQAFDFLKISLALTENIANTKKLLNK